MFNKFCKGLQSRDWWTCLTKPKWQQMATQKLRHRSAHTTITKSFKIEIPTILIKMSTPAGETIHTYYHRLLAFRRVTYALYRKKLSSFTGGPRGR